jgi:hypothetical protein
MSFLYITEFARQARDVAGYLVQGTPEYPATAEQVVAVGAGSVQSAVLRANTAIVELVSDVVCSVAVGVNPTATANARRIPANVPVQIGVSANSGFKIACITNT